MSSTTGTATRPRPVGSRHDTSDVTIVLICHDERRWKYLEKSVASALEQSAARVVLGVDHNEALAARARARWPELDVVPNRHQRGASGTRNAASELASTPLIAFMDDDVVAMPDWLATLCAAMDDPEIVGAGGRIIPFWAGGERPRWFPLEFGWVVGVSFTGMPDQTSPVRNVWGGNMLVRRDAFEAADRFRTSFSKVGDRARPEDTELCLRVAAAVSGGRWLYVPDSHVGHQVPPQRCRFGYFLTRSYQEGHGKVELDDLVADDELLAEEKHYLTRTLPRGFAAGLGDALRGDPAGLARAGAIVAGTAAAGVGAAASRIASRHPATTLSPAAPAESLPPAADAERARSSLARHEPPIWVGELDLADGPAELPIGSGHSWARILPRRGHAVGQPLMLPVVDGSVTRAAVVDAAGDWRPSGAAQDPPVWPNGLTVGVTVGTRDRPEQLRRMLESLVRVDAAVKVLVVDNAPSDDRTRRVVDEIAASDDRISYVLEPRPGLSVARNRALRDIDTDVLLYTDDDVEIDRNWIAVHAAAFADPRVVVSTGQAFAARLDVRDELLSEVTVAWGKGAKPRTFSLDDPPTDVPIFPFSPGLLGGGLNFAVRVAEARELGGFDETLGAGAPMRGGEDCDFMIRAVRRGATLRYDPNAFVWHHHRRDPGAFEKQRLDSAVGLGAYLAKLATDPAAGAAMVRRLPAGVRHFRRLRAVATDAAIDAEQRSSELSLTLRGALGYHRARRAVRAAGGHVADRPL